MTIGVKDHIVDINEMVEIDCAKQETKI